MRTLALSFGILGLAVSACNRSVETPATPAASTQLAPGPAAETESEANLEPVESVTLQPSEVVAGQSLQASVLDSSRRLLQFTWYANGEELFGERGDRIPGKYTKKGVSITVKVVPMVDGQVGDAVESAAVVVGNSAPRIASIDLVSSDGGTIVLQTRAEDIDADNLSYRLVTAPQGMVIDAQGLIRWNAGEIASPVTFSVAVSDGEHEFIQESTIGLQ
jgi:hypothetical protein